MSDADAGGNDTSAAIAELAAAAAGQIIPVLNHLGVPQEDHADVMAVASQMYSDPETAQAVGPLSDAVNLSALLEEAWDVVKGVEPQQ